MMKEHERIEKMTQNKIKLLEEDKQANEEEIKKFSALSKVINNQYNKFFSKIDMNIALRILKDIGIEKEELEEIYIKLVQEEISESYILMDINLKDEEER